MNRRLITIYFVVTGVKTASSSIEKGEDSAGNAAGKNDSTGGGGGGGTSSSRSQSTRSRSCKKVTEREKLMRAKAGDNRLVLTILIYML